MGFEDERDRRRKAENPLDTGASGAASGGAAQPKKRKRRGESAEIGQALRSVYDRTVGESIPAEMLDLLGKLD